MYHFIEMYEKTLGSFKNMLTQGFMKEEHIEINLNKVFKDMYNYIGHEVLNMHEQIGVPEIIKQVLQMQDRMQKAMSLQMMTPALLG